MRKCLGMLVFSLLLFSAATAPGQTESAGETITGEEYGIYRLVMAELAGRWAVDSKTLAGVRVDPNELAVSGIQVDTDIAEDFNEKNLKAYKLVEALDPVPEPDRDLDGNGRKMATFSRIGFDRERRRALLIVARTFYYPEDIMNAGKYIFLEKKNGQWTIAGTAAAWSMQLGPIR